MWCLYPFLLLRIKFVLDCFDLYGQIEIENVDRTGTFLGTLWESKMNVSVLLLEAGLAKLQPFFSSERITEGHLLAQAEERAKKSLLKVTP